MDSIDELKSQFLVSSSLSEAKMLSLLKIAVEHCAVDQRGHVELKTEGLAARDKMMLILSARYIAHHLDESIAMDVSADELAKNALIAPEQVRARTSDLVRDKMVEASSRGVFRALAHKIEPFLKGLAPGRGSKNR